MKDHHEHTKTSTSLGTRIRFMGHSCSFFCNRKTDTDVIEPRDTKPNHRESVAVEAITVPEIPAFRPESHRTQSL